jgi:hypothetical protein
MKPKILTVYDSKKIRLIVTNALKELLGRGIVASMQAFHDCAVNNAQDCRIAKATV